MTLPKKDETWVSDGGMQVKVEEIKGDFVLYRVHPTYYNVFSKTVENFLNTYHVQREVRDENSNT